MQNLDKLKAKWQFLNNAYNGEGGFSDGSYLMQFSREVDEKFKSRQNMAYYVNYLKPSIERFASYIFKNSAMRNSNYDLIKIIFDNCDNGGNSLNIFIQNFFKNAFLFGINLILVDMPRTLPSNLKEQKEKRAVPYFVEVSPLNLHDFSYKNGVFEWAILRYEVEIKKPFEKSEILTEFHYYDSTKFEKRDKDFNIIETIEHNLGLCPLLALNFSSEFLGDTIAHEIAEISRRIYNARSELDEILRGQTFSILAYHIPEGAPLPESLKISTDNVILFSGEAPRFISPSAENANIYINQIENLEKIITEISLNPVNLSTKSSDTGVALQFKFENLNGFLLNLAKKLEDFERRVFEVVFKWLKINYDYEIIYPSNFQISDLKSEIENASALSDFGLPTPWKVAKMKQLARLDLNGISDDEMNEIYETISDNAEI